MALADAVAKKDALFAQLTPIQAELSRLTTQMNNELERWNTEAIHLAACHAEWSAKRAAMIAKFFQEV